ncbi:hypothetical protein PCANB_001121 [Pneumocystis canis]|nr:hypothetical protein PCANB_001121 [Pneumocystis canis]
MKRKLNIIIKFHRKLSTERSWLPPKITEFSESKDHSIQRLIDFYSKLPQGPFIQPPSKHLFEKYRSTFFNGHGNRYFLENEGLNETMNETRNSMGIFAFKKPKLKSASINREFLSKASHPMNTFKGGNLNNNNNTNNNNNNTNNNDKNVINSTSIQPGKPRLTTKISSSSYTMGTYQDGLLSKQFDNKSSGFISGTSLSSRLSQNGAPVWGRNKKLREYTDEELAAMHGIHLARRLSAVSDDDKAGKWDEMDDDETDWSDTIEFADGTKFALPHEDHTNETTGITSTTIPTDSPSVSSWTQIRSMNTLNTSINPIDITDTNVIIDTEKTIVTSSTQDIQEKQISKEKRFGEEHYDRSWSSQRPGAPQIYNVNTGKFDIVDYSTKSTKRGGKKGYLEGKLKAGHHISLLSRPNLSDNVKKDEITEIHEQKLYRSNDAANNETKESQAISNDEHRLVSHSTMETQPNITKPDLFQSLPSVDPIFHNIEAFQRAIMIEAKEKARLRREEEEMERRMQQERAKKKAEELARFTQKSKSTKEVSDKEEKKSSFIPKNSDISPIHSYVVSEDTLSSLSQQDSSVQIQDESKISDKLTEKEKNGSDSSHSYTKTSETQSYQSIVKSNKQKTNISTTLLPETDLETQHISKSVLKKTSSTISTESRSYNEKNRKMTETYKRHTHIDSKQKYSKTSHVNNHSNIDNNWRRERTNTTEKDLHRTWVPVNNLTQQGSLNPSDEHFFSLGRKRSSALTTNKDSSKSSPSHSRTSSRFFPTTTHTEVTDHSEDNKKLGENKDNTQTSGHHEKHNTSLALASKTSLSASVDSIQTYCSDIKSPIVILPPNSQASQTVPVQSSKHLSNAKIIPTTSSTTHPGWNVSQSTQHSLRPSTRSFDDVMEQLARAGNFAQNNEKFPSYHSTSKTKQSHIENDVFSVTTISPLEPENYSKNTANVSLHSLNNSNELLNVSIQPFTTESDTKPFVNIPSASSSVFTTHHHSVEQPKYFESPYEHTMDFTLYDEQEIDTLRLYLPETSPKHIKIKSPSTFLHKKSPTNTHLHIYNT